jgi:putative FmdB family regulatory protein
MPTYDYVCQECGHEFEEFQSITAAVLTDCPACKKSALKRLLGTGAGLIFKGSGFYATDYKSQSGKIDASVDRHKKAAKDVKDTFKPGGNGSSSSSSSGSSSSTSGTN